MPRFWALELGEIFMDVSVSSQFDDFHTSSYYLMILKFHQRTPETFAHLHVAVAVEKQRKDINVFIISLILSQT